MPIRRKRGMLKWKVRMSNRWNRMDREKAVMLRNRAIEA